MPSVRCEQRARGRARLKAQRDAQQKQGELARKNREAAIQIFADPDNLKAILGIASLGELNEVGPRKLPLGLTAPVFVMAPMVKQSGLAFRDLVRAHSCTLCYSEMMMADEFSISETYRRKAFGNGVGVADHPLVVQFAAGDPDVLLLAALAAQQMGADAVDLNLGCPQPRAREHGYGAWLASDIANWPRIDSMVRTCASCKELRIPVLCKVRLQPTLHATVEFARMLEDAGCAMLAIHGRQLAGDAQNCRRQDAANLEAIAAVRASLHIPVITNGNVQCAKDVFANLKSTHCEGIMCGEQLLRDPALFQRAVFEERRSEEANAAVPGSVALADELLVRCHCLDDKNGETFTVWDSDNAEVVRRHLKAMYTGSVNAGGAFREEWLSVSAEMAHIAATSAATVVNACPDKVVAARSYWRARCC